MRWLVVLPMMYGCSGGDVVTLEGVVVDGPLEDAPPLASASLTLREGDGEAFSEATSGSDGRFSMDAPGGQNVFLEVRGEGLVPSSFTGVIGVDDFQEIDEGLVFGFREEELDGWRETFAGCPGVGDAGAAVIGEIRLLGFANPETGEEPLITTGYASVETSEGEVFTACYLNEEGTLFDEEAMATGATGRYAIFDLPSGIHTLVVGYEAAPGVVGEHRYFLWLPEEGVSPRFPSYVELVF